MIINQELISSFQQFPRSVPEDSVFVSFEGIEGAGKTTQIQLLGQKLLKQGWEVHILREPGGTSLGEKLRQSILKSTEKLSPLTETLIFLASRCELLSKKIFPLLQKKKQAVILDRYLDSTLSYQGVARGVGIEEILRLHQVTPLNLLPHQTFYLEISEQTSRLRQKQRGHERDYFEREDEDFYRSIKKGFDQVAILFPQRVKTISAEGEFAFVHQQIINHWQSFFGIDFQVSG